MRGKVITTFGLPLSYRITPAYAGKSRLYRQAVSVLQDHPRLCGEKVPPAFSVSEMSGSPPPMRGKARLRAVLLTLTGITPAYAGKREQRKLLHRKK